MARFPSAVGFQKDYAVIDVRVPDGDIREKDPVFAGNPPMETWPGEWQVVYYRVDWILLASLGAQLTKWLDTLETSCLRLITALELTPLGMLSSPTEVAMSPARSGVAVDFTLNDIGLEYEFWWNDPTTGEGRSHYHSS